MHSVFKTYQVHCVARDPMTDKRKRSRISYNVFREHIIMMRNASEYQQMRWLFELLDAKRVWKSASNAHSAYDSMMLAAKDYMVRHPLETLNHPVPEGAHVRTYR